MFSRCSLGAQICCFNLNYFVIVITTFFMIINDTFSTDFVGLKIEL